MAKLLRRNATVTSPQVIDLTVADDLTVSGSFTSPGIDDNADANAITIDSSERVGINATSPRTKLEIVQSAFGAGEGLRLAKTLGEYWDFDIFADSGNKMAITNYHAGQVMTMNNSGNVGIGTTSPSAKLHSTGDIFSEGGLYVGSYAGQNGIRTASNGSSSTTLYIGNQTITTSSDERIKENIVDTEIDAMKKLDALRVVDFTWNDPSDTSFNNKNARGKYTGFIAQEVIDVLPFCVNAVRDEETLTPQPNAKIPAIPDTLYENGDQIPQGKKIGDVKEKGTPEMDALWGMEYQYIVPVLVKAVQELSAKVTALENA